MATAALIWLVTLIVAGMFAAGRWWFPEPISAHARAFDSSFALTLWVTGAIFFAAQFVLGWAIWRHRKSSTPVPNPGNEKLEIFWTAAALVLFVGIAAASTSIWSGVHLDPVAANAIRIEAAGKQFAFNFRYPGKDGKFGRTDIKLINDATGNPFGLDDKDPAARDDIATAALRVPAGRPVVLLLKSRDVIHNFFVRELRLKQDLVPGMEIPLAFTADKPGTYSIACSELCGLGHHQMQSSLIVLEPEAFDKWLDDAHAELQIVTNAEAR
ncbi:MAG: cytochrome c oxidase subunit II [Bryobacteraceae bacterium]